MRGEHEHRYVHRVDSTTPYCAGCGLTAEAVAAGETGLIVPEEPTRFLTPSDVDQLIIEVGGPHRSQVLKVVEGSYDQGFADALRVVADLLEMILDEEHAKWVGSSGATLYIPAGKIRDSAWLLRRLAEKGPGDE